MTLRTTTVPISGATIALSLAALSVVGFSAVGHLEAQESAWRFGNYRFLNTAQNTPALEVRPAGPVGLRSFGFVGTVGGASFEAVARPSIRLANLLRDAGCTGIELTYDPSSPDGKRLVFTVGNERFKTAIPDWQLVPIANYADSEYTAAVSLFGEGPDENYYYIQYHPSFKDTLLGLRLLQADIILIDVSGLRQLPTNDNGELVLGAGETVPVEETSQRAAEEIEVLMEGYYTQSWVLTDVDEKIFIMESSDTIRLLGEPYYYFWISDRMRAVQLEARLRAYVGELQQQGKVAESQMALGQLQRILTDMGEIDPRIFDDDYEPQVEEVRDLTNILRERSDLLRDLNPAVYDAVSQIAKYSAFFRYIKHHCPGQWGSFLEHVTNVEINPAVVTPTQWERPTAE